MTEQRMAFLPRQLGLALSLLLVVLAPGCVHKGAIPVRQLPPQFREEPVRTDIPIDWSLLRQTPPDQYVLASGDTVGIVVKSILGGDIDSTFVLPPNEMLERATAGRPYEINSEGSVTLPMVGEVNLANMTIPEANRIVSRAYFDNGFLNEDNAEIEVRLFQPRQVEVHVIREDSDSSLPLAIRSDQQFHVKRGSSQIVKLDMYKNDVLHALEASGGLPGIDARNQIWIIRGQGLERGATQTYLTQIAQANVTHAPFPADLDGRVVCIPLSAKSGRLLNIEEEDIILQDGDVMFIGDRDTDFFITGGLIDGQKIPLPRDYDVDVLTAIALANGTPLGPAAGARSNNFQLGPGNILPPTRLTIVRQVPSGDQIKILVDLDRAVEDEHERIKVLPGDLLILEYTKTELFLNVMLNLVNLNLSLDQI